MAQVYNRTFTPEKWEKVNKVNKEIINDFITECKAQKKSAGTQKQYFNDCRIVAIYCLEQIDNKSFLELGKRDFRNFVIYCQEVWGLSSARINRLLSCIHMLLNFCENDDELYEDYTRNASEKVKGLPKEPVREITFISDEVIGKLYDKLMKEERYREATLLAILYDSGCRKNEVLQVERASITDEGNATNMVVGKRSKKFKCLYFSRTKESFKKYEAAREDDNKMLFVTSTGNTATDTSVYIWVRGWEKDLLELTGDEYTLNVHTFRHCFVQNFLDGSHYLCKEMNLGAVPLEKVKTLCHHESSDTTLNYADNNEDRDIEDLFGIKL